MSGNKLAANIGQKVTNLFEGAKRQAGNLREWVGKFFRKTGDDLPGGSRPVQKIIDRSAELAKLDAEALAQMKRALSYLEGDMEAAAQVERALDKYVVGQFISDSEDINRVTRIGEEAMDAYEAGKKPLQTVTSHFGEKFFDFGRAWREGWDSNPLIDAMIGAGVGFTVEGAHQLYEGELNEKDLLLAIGTGGVLGGSVGVRKKVAGESYGEAFAQVGFGAGFNALALIGGPALTGSSVKPSDVYFAALYGGLASPVTYAAERGFGRIIPNKRVSETIADAVVGSTFTGTQYLISTLYRGENISNAAITGNFLGGALGGGLASLSPDIPLPGKWGKFADDLLVPGAGTFFGGGLLPPLIEMGINKIK